MHSQTLNQILNEVKAIGLYAQNMECETELPEPHTKRVDTNSYTTCLPYTASAASAASVPYPADTANAHSLLRVEAANPTKALYMENGAWSRYTERMSDRQDIPRIKKQT